MKPSHEFSRWIFRLVPYEVIHKVGIGVFALIAAAAVAGAVNLVRQYSRALGGMRTVRGLPWSRLAQAWKEVGREIVTMKRHGQCDVDQGPTRWHLTPRIIHYSIMAGFVGLFSASMLDFLFIYLLDWHAFPPARVLGTVSGLVMLYGVSVSMVQRYQARANHLKHSTLADWWLLVFLVVLAITGFWLELAVTFRWQNRVDDAVLLVHTAMAMELVLLFMATKLAHAIYRPLALGLYFIQKQQNLTQTN